MNSIFTASVLARIWKVIFLIISFMTGSFSSSQRSLARLRYWITSECTRGRVWDSRSCGDRVETSQYTITACNRYAEKRGVSAALTFSLTGFRLKYGLFDVIVFCVWLARTWRVRSNHVSRVPKIANAIVQPSDFVPNDRRRGWGR